jgi:hypothetical protein
MKKNICPGFYTEPGQIYNYFLLVTAAAATAARTSAAAATTAAETAATRASAAAATAASAVPAAAFVGFIYLDLPAAQVFIVHSLNGCLSLFLRRHFNETETSRFTAELILYNAYGPNLTVRLKSLPQLLFRHLSCQITYINVHLKNPQNKN